MICEDPERTMSGPILVTGGTGTLGRVGAALAGLRRGNLLAPDHAVGRVTFGQFLAERFRRADQAGQADRGVS
jgi:hypothetical protein